MNYVTADISFLTHSLGAKAPDIFPTKQQQVSTTKQQRGIKSTTDIGKTRNNGSYVYSHEILQDAVAKKAVVASSSEKHPTFREIEKDNKKFIKLKNRLQEQLETESRISDISSILLIEHTRRVIEEGKIRINAKDKLLQRKQYDIEWLKQNLLSESTQLKSKDKLLHAKQCEIESLLQEKSKFENNLKMEKEENERLLINKECEIATLKNKLIAKKNVSSDVEKKYALLLGSKYEVDSIQNKLLIERDENYKLLNKKECEIQSLKDELTKEVKIKDRLIHIKNCEILSLKDKCLTHNNKVEDKDKIMQLQKHEIELLNKKLLTVVEEKNNALKNKEFEIESLKIELSEEVKTKDKLIHVEKCEMESLQVALSNLTSEMKEKDKMILDQHFDMDELEEKISSEIEHKDAILIRKDCEIESLQDELTKLIATKDRIITMDRCEIASLEDKCSILASKVEKKDKLLNNKKCQIESLQNKSLREMEEKNNIIKNKDFNIKSLISKLSKESETKDRQIESLQDKSLHEMEEKNNVIKNKEFRIKSLENKLSKETRVKDRQLHIRTCEVVSLEDKLSMLSDKIKGKEKLLLSKKCEIKELKESLSTEKLNGEVESLLCKLAAEELEKDIKPKKIKELQQKLKRTEDNLSNALEEIEKLNVKVNTTDNKTYHQEPSDHEIEALKEHLSTERVNGEVESILWKLAMEEMQKDDGSKYANELQIKLKNTEDVFFSAREEIEQLTSQVNVMEDKKANHKKVETGYIVECECSSIKSTLSNVSIHKKKSSKSKVMNNKELPKKNTKNKNKSKKKQSPKNIIPRENRKLVSKKDAIDTLHKILSQIDIALNNKDDDIDYDALLQYKQSIVKMTKNVEKCDVVGKDTFATSVSNIKTSLLRYGIIIDIAEEWNEFESGKKDVDAKEKIEQRKIESCAEGIDDAASDGCNGTKLDDNLELVSKKGAIDTLHTVLSHIDHALNTKDKHAHYEDLLQFKRSIVKMAKKIEKCDVVGKSTFTKSILNIKASLLRYGITISKKNAIDTLNQILSQVDHALNDNNGHADRDSLLQLQGSIYKMVNNIQKCDIVGKGTFITSVSNIKTSLSRYGVTVDLQISKTTDAKGKAVKRRDNSSAEATDNKITDERKEEFADETRKFNSNKDTNVDRKEVYAIDKMEKRTKVIGDAVANERIELIADENQEVNSKKDAKIRNKEVDAKEKVEERLNESNTEGVDDVLIEECDKVMYDQIREFLLNHKMEERLNESIERVDTVLIDESNEVMYDQIKEFLLSYKVEERLNESAERVPDALIDECNEVMYNEIKEFLLSKYYGTTACVL